MPPVSPTNNLKTNLNTQSNSKPTTFTGTIRLREKGQITLPVKILKQLGIKAGDLFTIKIDNIPAEPSKSSKVSISIVKDTDPFARFRELIKQKPGTSLKYSQQEEDEERKLEILAEERGY
jgi:bifunctional DNA-binding transcriptional regulator/antitoxin component of YhaV-PrlF toxin-antitoxin module